MNKRVSAVICTLNRAEYLRKALASLVNQTLTEDNYEIIIVDNGSVDNTYQLVNDECIKKGNIRYIYEPIIGLSHARNTGWRNSYGDYVAYLDDDAVASPSWLEKILDGFTTVSPCPGLVGGKIEPIWEADKPVWLADQLLGFLGILDLSTTPVLSLKNQVLAGANMAVSRQVLNELGGFPLELGRKGDNLVSNEDVLLQLKAIKNGYPCYYDPEIIVRHHIHTSRLTKKWFLYRMYWEGVSIAYMQEHLDSLSVVKRMWRFTFAACRIVFSVRKFIYLAFFTSKAERFAWMCFNRIQVGYIAGLLGKAK